jgi:predicted N-acetyltransferase YhbS
MISIEKLNESDKEKVFELGKKIFREEDELPLLKKALTFCDNRLSFIAFENNSIIGFTLTCKRMTHIYFKFISEIPNCYELAFLGISPNSQGRGLGTRLLKETLLAIFQTSNQFTCWLLVDTINIGAIKLYEKNGFRRWKETSIEKTFVPGYIMGISYKRFKHNYQNESNKLIMCQQM